MPTGLNNLSENEWKDYVYGPEEEITEDIDDIEEEKTYTSKEIILLYNDLIHNKNINNILNIKFYQELITIIDNHNVYDKVDNLRNKITNMYYDVFKKFIEKESPTHILNAKTETVMMLEFIDMVFNSSEEGYELNIIINIKNNISKKISYLLQSV